MNDIVRADIEKTIKEFSLDRSKVFEVSKQKYEQICYSKSADST